MRSLSPLHFFWKDKGQITRLVCVSESFEFPAAADGQRLPIRSRTGATTSQWGLIKTRKKTGCGTKPIKRRWLQNKQQSNRNRTLKRPTATGCRPICMACSTVPSSSRTVTCRQRVSQQGRQRGASAEVQEAPRGAITPGTCQLGAQRNSAAYMLSRDQCDSRTLHLEP